MIDKADRNSQVFFNGNLFSLDITCVCGGSDFFFFPALTLYIWTSDPRLRVSWRVPNALSALSYLRTGFLHTEFQGKSGLSPLLVFHQAVGLLRRPGGRLGERDF
jgi:hypothetical protein